jgi:arsenate reductase
MEIWVNPACSKKGLPRDAASRGAWLDALASHPRLIQGPIITADDGTTAVGRDGDSLTKVISAEIDG